MRLRLLSLAVFALFGSGCFNFDDAYAQYCDAGRCASGVGGGEATGGGAATGGGTTGGGTTGGGTTGGGTTGGGTTGGGGATGGGSATDAGCPNFLCPVVNWSSGQSGRGVVGAPGINAQSLDRFNVYASYESAPPARFVTHYEYRFINNVPSTIPRTNFPGNRDAKNLRGVSLTDQWFNYFGAAQHIVGTATPQVFTSCNAPDGGTDPWHQAAFPVSADDVWLVGHPMSICHWTADGGLFQTADRTGWDNVYLTDVYRSPAGDLFAVGGNYLNSDGVSIAFREDGTQWSVPNIIDAWYSDGFNSVDGTGGEVYILARDDSAGHGVIVRLMPDAGFETAYTANFRLARLDVTPRGEVWAVGASNSAIYFDGGSWAEVTLPTSENRFSVTFDNVAATDDGVIFTGKEPLDDAGIGVVVHTYRRQGK